MRDKNNKKNIERSIEKEKVMEITYEKVSGIEVTFTWMHFSENKRNK